MPAKAETGVVRFSLLSILYEIPAFAGITRKCDISGQGTKVIII